MINDLESYGKVFVGCRVVLAQSSTVVRVHRHHLKIADKNPGSVVRITTLNRLIKDQTLHSFYLFLGPSRSPCQKMKHLVSNSHCVLFRLLCCCFIMQIRGHPCAEYFW